jgi:Tol biopolymer transport system component
MNLAGEFSVVALALACLVGSAAGQVTTRASVNSQGVQANGASPYPPSISADGRILTFYSSASSLVVGDANGSPDIFVRNLRTGVTTRVSVNASGQEANGTCDIASMSADGRFVAFGSLASNLVPGDTNGVYDIFVRDLSAGTITRASVDSAGAESDGDSLGPSLSADGRFVAFYSLASNFGAGPLGVFQVYVHDLQTGSTVRVSEDAAGVAGDANSFDPSISADGADVAFTSHATNLVPGDTNGCDDVFLRNLAGTIQRVSVDSTGVEANGASGAPALCFTFNRHRIAFQSLADNLVPGDTNGVSDVFLRELANDTTSRLSLDPLGVEGDGASLTPSFSPDCRYVAFESQAANLVAGDTNLVSDAFVRDLELATTTRVSLATSGEQGNQDSRVAAISEGSRFVAFVSLSSNLVANDTNNVADVFLRDFVPTEFTRLCVPGIDGVAECPCSNDPGGADRGCENSSGTGGAMLSASGVSYLSLDTLEFSTSGERPSALSVLLQGPATLPSGVVYGQGVRCVGGSLRRLYSKSAVMGSITVPEIVHGDMPVSARSAELGDVIQPGQSRWYLVYYRDPVVLGGCPAGSTFNSTQTGRVDWMP